MDQDPVPLQGANTEKSSGSGSTTNKNPDPHQIKIKIRVRIRVVSLLESGPASGSTSKWCGPTTVNFKLDQNPSFAGSGSGFIPSFFFYPHWISDPQDCLWGTHLMDPTWSSKEMTLGWTISRVKWDTALDTESSSFASVELTSIRDDIRFFFLYLFTLRRWDRTWDYAAIFCSTHEST